MTVLKPRKFGFFFHPGFALMSAASAVEPLRAANLLSRETIYDPIFVSARGGLVESSSCASFETIALSDLSAHLDLLFVVAGGNQFDFADKAVLAALGRLARSGVPLGGISGGSAILSAANLMQDRRHTIHWMHLDELRAIYPDANVERRLYVIDRDRFTCAGGTAPLDMMCAIITKHHGADLARAVSNWFIHTAIRKAEEPQQEHQVSMPVFGHPALDVALELIQNHIGDPLTLADLAFLSKISERQLERVAKDRLGMSLMRYYRTIRLKKADDLLSHSNMTIEAIAQATGFSDRSHFSRVFQGAYLCGPSARRKSRHRSNEK